jgi:short-subunit dehydrogenase
MKHTILITGARRGIGKEAAVRLAKNGHDVIATTRTRPQAENLQKDMDQAGLGVQCEKCDILDPDDRAKAKLWQPTVLVNNAAIGASGPIESVPAEVVEETFETNVYATLALTQAVFPHIKNVSGRVIFVSSVGGRITLPHLGAYAMTKHAIESMADSFRREHKRDGVNISIIEPGAIATGFNEKMNAEKYEWMDKSDVSEEKMQEIQTAEEALVREQFPPDSVAKSIVHAVESPRPRTRYVRPYRFGIYTLLDKLCPSSWIDKLIEVIYK